MEVFATVLFIILSECGFKFILGLRLYEKNNTDSYLTSLQIIKKYGYPAESHMTMTEDGYILELHRIPQGKHSNPSRHGIPVLIQHGILGSSVDFLFIGPNKALAYLLADKGYDVWLGNVRGNTYSRGHKSLTPEDKGFWDFSWHESGLYDLPAQIDYICNITQRNDILYIGFSMGTTMFFVMTSSRPEYQSKIRGGIMLAAVGYLRDTRTPIRFLAPLANDLQFLSELLTDGELIQQSVLYRYLARITCTLNHFERDLCRNILFLFTGCDPYQFNEDLLPIFLNHVPAGASTKTVTHYAQLIQSGKFRQFDYGPKENSRRYNSTVPPEYNVESINVPLHIFEGPNDFLSTLSDVNRLIKRLPNVRSENVIDYHLFNHLDFVMANDAKTLLYDKVIERLDSFAYEMEEDREKKDYYYYYDDLNNENLNEKNLNYKIQNEENVVYKSLNEGNLDYKSLNEGNLDYKNLNEGSLDYKSIKEGNLDYKNLNEENLDYKNLNEGSLDYKSLKEGNLDYKNLNEENLDYKNLNEGSLDYKSIKEGNLDYKSLNEGNLDYKNLNEGSLDYKSIKEGNLDYKNLNEENLDYKNLNEGSLDYKNLNEGSLDYKSLKEGNLDYKNLNEENLDYKNLNEGSLDYKSIKEGNLDYKSLNEGILDYESLNGENLVFESLNRNYLNDEDQLQYLVQSVV